MSTALSPTTSVTYKQFEHRAALNRKAVNHDKTIYHHRIISQFDNIVMPPTSTTK